MKQTEEIDLTPGASDVIRDPMRIYLGEMGVAPLLTREGEVEIARSIEGGQLNALEALSRSQQVLEIGENLKDSPRSIRDVVTCDEEEVTEEILQNQAEDVTHRSSSCDNHCKTALRLATMQASKKVRADRRWLTVIRCPGFSDLK